MSNFIAGRMRIEPLMPKRLAPYASIQKALRIAKQDLLRRLKRKLGQSQAFSARAKAAFQRAIKVDIKPASLAIRVEHPAFEPLVRGRKKKQMLWLKKARRPIPIITETGKLIFRTAHARSLTWTNGPMTGPNVGQRKGWVHPGRTPDDFVEKAKKDARVFLKEKLRKELTEHVRSAFAKSETRRK